MYIRLVSVVRECQLCTCFATKHLHCITFHPIENFHKDLVPKVLNIDIERSLQKLMRQLHVRLFKDKLYLGVFLDIFWQYAQSQVDTYPKGDKHNDYGQKYIF